MTPQEMEAIVTNIGYPGYVFEVKLKNGVPFLQARYLEADIITGAEEWQHTRKWQLSEHMVKSEIVQTALKCVLTSAEHRVREHFLYRGERVFQPHFDVDALYEIAKAKRVDYRGKPQRANVKPCECTTWASVWQKGEQAHDGINRHHPMCVAQLTGAGSGETKD